MVKIKNILKRLLLTVVAGLTVTGAMGINVVPVHAETGDVTVTPAEGQTLTQVTEAGDKTISITTPSGITDDDTVTYTIYKIFNASNATGGGRNSLYFNS